MTKSEQSPTENWWEHFYDAFLANVLLEGTDPAEIVRTVEFLEQELGLSEGDSVFDQCCGNGRLSVPLARKGYRVTGIDLTKQYIEAARLSAREAGADDFARFEAADAFEFLCEAPCVAGINWWTSFGYAGSDEENLRMLNRAFESIVPGGRFALDFMNVPGVLSHFKPQVITHGQSESDGEILLVRESEVDVAHGVLRKRWTYYLESGRRVRHRSAVRLYDPPALKALFEAAGFRGVRIYGDLDASAITLESPRCIVVGQHPA